MRENSFIYTPKYNTLNNDLRELFYTIDLKILNDHNVEDFIYKLNTFVDYLVHTLTMESIALNQNSGAGMGKALEGGSTKVSGDYNNALHDDGRTTKVKNQDYYDRMLAERGRFLYTQNHVDLTIIMGL